MGDAWRSWSESPDSFLAFPWLHAVGQKPTKDDRDSHQPERC